MSRRISRNIEQVINNHDQTSANQSKLTSIVEIKRPYTVLKDDFFLEKLELDLGQVLVEDVDIAVSHPRLAHPNENIFITAIGNGVARVYKSPSYYLMDHHKFVDLGYEKLATAVSIGFEAIMEPNYRYQQERITSDNPWWFYVTPLGELFAMELETGDILPLATENVTDVSCVSGPWHWSVDFDYGLMVFFIAGGLLMCKRLIKGYWYNTEVISFGPGAPYATVSAQLTWDHRVALTVSKTDGTVHTIFTNFLGLGKFTSEVIEAGTASDYKAALEGMQYLKGFSDEDVVRIQGSADTTSTLIFKGPSVPTKVYNIKSTTVEWGRVLRVEFNLPIISTGFDITKAFELEDSVGRKNVFLSGIRNADGTLDLTFDGFNDMIGECTLTFTPGVLRNEFLYDCEPWSFTFTPTNLNGNSVPYPTEEILITALVDIEPAVLLELQKLKGYSDGDIVNINESLSDITAVLTHISEI